MRSSFFGLNVAVSGLYTAQRNLSTVSHNINNVNTPGFSRQQNIQRASNAMALFDGTGMVGTGSEVMGVERIRDKYLDYKFWSENVALGEWQVKAVELGQLERVFNEPSDNGFTKVLNEFFGSMQDLTKDPSSLAARSVVINRGIALSKYFNNLASNLEKVQLDNNYSVKIKVDEVNALASQIGQLNRQIYTLEVDGNMANDLRDQRGVLVDKLSKLVNIEAGEVVVGKLANGHDNNHFLITINGKPIVDHFGVTKLQVEQRKNKLNNEDIENLYQVSWEDGNSIEIRGGELKGYLDMRDGNGVDSNFKGVPFYINKLNTFVRKFALAMNEGITEGIDASGNKIFNKIGNGHADGLGLQKPGSSTIPSGIRFFTMKGWMNNKYTELDSENFVDASVRSLTGQAGVDAIGTLYGQVTAKTFSISGDFLNKQYAEYNIAASGISGKPEDISNLTNMIDMRYNSHLFIEGTPEDYMKSLVSFLGIDSQQSMRFYKNQEVLTDQIDNRRTSISGVSIDEEMANMVKFQHAYNAAAKMITTMSQVYDTLINRIGVR